eukprot:6633837-Pyramimonas_sp.AAC.1
MVEAAEAHKAAANAGLEQLEGQLAVAVRAVARQQAPPPASPFFLQVSRFMGEPQNGPVAGVPPHIQ